MLHNFLETLYETDISSQEFDVLIVSHFRLNYSGQESEYCIVLLYCNMNG